MAVIARPQNTSDTCKKTCCYSLRRNAIKKMKAHQKGKLLIEIEPIVNEEIIVSQENAAAFKDWIGS